MPYRTCELGLMGEFPRGIEDYKEVVNLDLLGNEFSGSIPSRIGNCSYLEVLYYLVCTSILI